MIQKQDTCEEGLGTVMSLDGACDLGRLYLQDAIYHIKNDQISVTYCDQKKKTSKFWIIKIKVKILRIYIFSHFIKIIIIIIL